MLISQETRELYFTDLDTPIGKIVNLTIACLIFLSSMIFVIETYDISDDVRFCLDVVDNIIVILFLVEYLLNFWSANHKIKYIFSLYSIIDLMAILPLFFGTDISFIRLLRWFRILRLIRFLDKKSSFSYIAQEDNLIFVRILFTLFAIIFVYSGLIYQVEHPVNSQVFSTFLDAFYFSVVTMTTVGFGDVTPISELGRLLTVLMILTGVALVPWQVGDLIKRLVKTTNQVNIICANCGLAFHDNDAKFCKQCGTKLNIYVQQE
ncbi:ion transporter [Calothrix sp. 336/3]|uniref:ion transporter n=1 Tax=Calothrix sp. 336/3 TaxID=1337936 RepID=UPI0004E39416|nr:ion transporter [Calothrix sp. 336/3]AKG23295.1 Ion transporter [Calothrix sp. 336/3]